MARSPKHRAFWSGPPSRRVEVRKSHIALPPSSNKHPNTLLVSGEVWLQTLLSFNRRHALVRTHNRLSLWMLY